MKKFVLLFWVILFFPMAAFSHSGSIIDDILFQKQITEIGFKILNSSNIESRMTFLYKNDEKIKPSTSTSTNKIVVHGGLKQLIEDDNELAAILSREIAYTENGTKSLFRRTAMGYSPLKYDKKANRRAVDYMVNAGYNPVALIIVLNKYAGEPNWFEKEWTCYNGSKRQLFVYEYIYSKYPEFIAQNEYLKNSYYQNFLRSTVEQRAKITKAKEIQLKIQNETEKSENI